MSTIHVPFQYVVHGRLKRERTLSIRVVRDTVAVEIPDLASADVEGRVGIPHAACFGADDGRFPVVGGRILAATHYESGHYGRPEGSFAVTPRATEEIYLHRRFDRLLPTTRTASSPFYDLPEFDFAHEDPALGSRASRMHAKAMAPADAEWAERVWDDRDGRMAEAAAAAAADTVALDGTIHTARCEPLWMDRADGGWGRIHWHPVRRPLSETAAHRCHLPIDARRADLVAAHQPTGDVGLVLTRMPKDRIRLSRLLQTCASLVFPCGAQEDAFAGSGDFAKPDVHPALEDAVRMLRRAVRAIDAATAPADPEDGLAPFAREAAEALRAWEDGMAAHGFHRGNPKQSLAARRVVDSASPVAAALESTTSSGPSATVEWAEDPGLEGFSM